MGKETLSASPNNATPEQQRISEVNMSYYVFHCRDLLGALDYIRPNNAPAVVSRRLFLIPSP